MAVAIRIEQAVMERIATPVCGLVRDDVDELGDLS